MAAFDDPNLEKDLQKYSKTFELAACTKHKSCLTKVNQKGEAEPLPPSNPGWAEEISIDVEMAHAICQHCHIVVVEADSEESADLEAAEETAVKLKADEISNSWVEPEPATETRAFDQPGVVITAGSGDEGLLNWVPGSPEAGEIDYPASSPNVVSVGGTRLEDVAGTWTSSVWNGEGVGEERGATGRGLQRTLRSPLLAARTPRLGAGGLLRETGRRRTSPPSATPTPASRSTTARPAKAVSRPTGKGSEAPASRRRSSPPCSRSPAAPARTSNIPRGRCMKTRRCTRRR